MKIECPICFGKLKPPYLILGERCGFHLSCVIYTLLSSYSFGIEDAVLKDLANDMRLAVGAAEAKTKKRRRKPRHE
jgi:hypothetical protein